MRRTTSLLLASLVVVAGLSFGQAPAHANTTACSVFAEEPTDYNLRITGTAAFMCDTTGILYGQWNFALVIQRRNYDGSITNVLRVDRSNPTNSSRHFAAKFAESEQCTRLPSGWLYRYRTVAYGSVNGKGFGDVSDWRQTALNCR